MSKPSSLTIYIASQNPHSTTHAASTSKINVVQSTNGKSHQPGSKKKGKGKKKKDSSPQDKQNNRFSEEKRKHHYPCLICNKECFTHYYPHRAELN